MIAEVVLENPAETFSVVIDARDRRAFERSGRRAVGLPEGPLRETIKSIPETYVAWLAWHAASRHGLVPGLAFDEFEKRLIDVNADEDDDEDDLLPDPTRPGP